MCEVGIIVMVQELASVKRILFKMFQVYLLKMYLDPRTGS